MDISDVSSRFMDYRCNFDGMDSDLSPNSRDSNETGSSSSPPQSVTLSPRTFHELGLMSFGDSLAEPFAEPFLCVTVEPGEKFRFRYKSETTGVHGAITGRNRTKANRSFPSVQLFNWTAPAVIRCSLFTGQPDPALRTPSCHQLVVKGGHGTDGTHSIAVNDGDHGASACFAGMAIINTANKDKMAELSGKLESRMLEKKRQTHGPSAKLSAREKLEVSQEAETLSKDAQLSNTVSLCFECFDSEMRSICAPVFSGTISNLKCAMTNELKITRMDKHTSSCLGKEEVFMLVEKVNKKHIKVRFYELDEEDALLWEDWGSFSELDVHHQYAIVFKTPPYCRTDIDRSVSVFVELYRPTDGARSDPVEFQYKPCEKQASHRRKKARRESRDRAETLTEALTDPMFFNGDSVDLPPYDLETFPSNTQSIEEVLNAPLLAMPELQHLVLHSLSTDWDLAIDGGSAAEKSPPEVARLSDKTAASESEKAEKAEETAGADLLRKVLKGCRDGAKRRTEASADLEDSFRELCSLRNAEGNTAVHLAVDSEDVPALDSLVKEMASYRCQDLVDLANNKQQTALHLGVCVDSPSMVTVLLRGGAELGSTNQEGRTPLHLAVDLGHDECLRVLLGSGRVGPAVLDLWDEQGLTALHLAVLRGNLSAVRQLCTGGAKPEVCARNGETALHLACQEGQLEIARCFVEEVKVAVDVQDTAGRTALDFAKAIRSPAIVDLLTSRTGSRPSNEADPDSDSDSETEFEDAESGSERESLEPGSKVTGSELEGLEPGSKVTGSELEGLEPGSKVTGSELEGLEPGSKVTGSELEGLEPGSKVTGPDSISRLSATRMQRLCDFLDERSRWKPLAEALDFGFLVNGIDAENVDSAARTVVNFLELNGVGMDRLRLMLTKISNEDKVAAIFDS